MTELDRLGGTDNFNIRGIPLFMQVCKKRSQATQKRWNVCICDSSTTFYSKILGVRLPVCPVNKPYQSLSSTYEQNIRIPNSLDWTYR